MRHILIVLGLILILLGWAWPYVSRLGIGRLPGDINIQGSGFSFHFPFATSILLSLFFSGMLWIWQRFMN